MPKSYIPHSHFLTIKVLNRVGGHIKLRPKHPASRKHTILRASFLLAYESNAAPRYTSYKFETDQVLDEIIPKFFKPRMSSVLQHATSIDGT